jgi:hypothetical protein
MEKVKIYVNGKEYKNIFTRVIWSGAIHGTARKLEVEYLGDIITNIGDEIVFSYEDEKLFFGKVFFHSRKGETDIKSFYAYDNSIYMNKNNFVKNFFQKKPSEILKEICGELNLKVGKIPKDEVTCTYPAIDRSGYEIILNAYTIQHRKNKKIYSIVSNEQAIDIVEQGTYTDVLLTSADNISTSSYEESIENMINQIVIYKVEKEKQQILNKVENAEDKKKYGLFQQVMEYEKDVDNIANAKDMLKSVEKSARIYCLGNILIQAGYNIGIQEPHTGLVGDFLVKSDTHIFEGETHFCNLELSFENVMDKVEFENKEKAKKNKKKKGKKAKKKDKINELFSEGWDKKK